MNIAVVDATAGTRAEPSAMAAACRYVTPIANLPLICHVFDELAAGGIKQARVVAQVSAHAELERVLEGGRSWEVAVSYVDAPEEGGTAAVLGEIDRALSEGSVLVHPGDCLFPRAVAAMCDRFRAGDVDLVLMGPEMDAPLRNRARLPEEPMRVCDTAVVLGRGTRRVVEDLLLPRQPAGDLVESLLASDCRAAIWEQTVHWFYGDSNQALLAANRLMLDALSVPAVDGEFADGNRVQGRVAISPEARISGSTLKGPLVIDDAAVVEDSFIGPYTAIGAGAHVSGAEIDNSMVFTGAVIRHPGARIEASIIGERTSIERSFDLPRGLHLRLGTGSQVTLS